MKIDLFLDKLSGHDSEGKIGKISKEVGEEFLTNDELFTVESGKGSFEFKAKTAGKVIQWLIDEGDLVKKGDKVGIMEGEAVSEQPPKQKYSFGITQPAKETISCDLAIVGGGPGGYVAAIRASQLGLKTVLIEKDKLGGTCLNYGCIPTKALVQSMHVLDHLKKAGDFGFTVSDFKIDFQKVMSRKNQVVEQLVGGISSLMEKNSIRVIHGEAKALDKQALSVKTKKIDATITFKNLILALGASPAIIPIEGADLPEVLTSKEALELDHIPASLTIIGGGIIGMEIAFIYNALGTKVDVIEYLPKILACLDDEAGENVKTSAVEKGIGIYTGSCVDSIRKTINDQMVTELIIGEKRQLISSEKVLIATGRKANIEGINLNVLDVHLNEDKNGVEINDFMQTSNPHIYAIGDLTNKNQLAHVASHQGIVAAEHIAGLEQKMHYDVIPSAVFTIPEVGAVGLTEEEADLKGIEIKKAKFPYYACGKAVAMNEPEGFVKLIADKKTNQLIGGTIVGSHASDLIATVTNLIKAKINLEEAQEVIYAHPTLAESIHEALLLLDQRGIHFA